MSAIVMSIFASSRQGVPPRSNPASADMAKLVPLPQLGHMSSSLAPFPLHPVVAGWRSEIENLSSHASPCRNLPPAKWATIRESALAFCNQFGNEAHRLGWTAPELFAVHPQHGTIGIDLCGVLMIGGEAARGVEANRVVFERTSGYRDGAGQLWGVPVWECAKGGKGRMRFDTASTVSGASAIEPKRSAHSSQQTRQSGQRRQ